jgi:anaerobic magnesium-protoporphyrin IX monomethyl ester cyclase
MRVLLVNPPHHGLFSLFGVKIPPLGLGYLAASLRKAGMTPTIADLTVARKNEFPDFGKFDLVGIGTDTTRFRAALQLAREAKKAGRPVVMGGPHPTVVDDAPFITGDVDFVARGEAEDTIVELARAVADGREPEGVAGLTYRRKGVLHRTPARPFREDLDALPWPARDLLPMDRYRSAKIGTWPLTPVVTSRGCPFRCTFCASSFMNGPKWRPRSAEKVVEEIEHVQKTYGYPAVAFSDDNSTLDAARMDRICEEIHRRGLDVKIWLFLRADTAFHHPDTIARMGRAGVTSAFMGIETLSKRHLKEIHKGFAPEVTPKAVRIVRDAGIDVLASYIIGYPDETLSEIRETIRQARALPTSTAQFTILTPYPGTKVFEDLKPRIRSWNWAHYDGHHAVFQPLRISRFALQMMLPYAHAAFYARSLGAVGNFARFLWRRRRGLGTARKAFHDMFMTPDVEASKSAIPPPERSAAANAEGAGGKAGG